MDKNELIGCLRDLEKSDGWGIVFKEDMLGKVKGLKNKMSYGNTLSIEDVRYLQGRVFEIEQIINYPDYKIRKIMDKKIQEE